jgi:hypothetical protein
MWSDFYVSSDIDFDGAVYEREQQRWPQSQPKKKGNKALCVQHWINHNKKYFFIRNITLDKNKRRFLKHLTSKNLHYTVLFEKSFFKKQQEQSWQA